LRARILGKSSSRLLLFWSVPETFRALAAEGTVRDCEEAMSEVLLVSEEVVRSMAASIAALQCDVATYKSAYEAILYSVRVVIAKRLLLSSASKVSAMRVVCEALEGGKANAEKIIADRAAEVEDDDADYCGDCCEPLSRESQMAGRCLKCHW
jgi:hypothetical protein